MKEIFTHIASKLFSGRWIWAVVSAVVFCFLSISGRLEPKDVMFVIGVVIGFYFNKPTTGKLEE